MIYIEGNNVLKSQNHYNSTQILVQRKRKWKLKESYREFYKTVGEGILFFISLVVTVGVFYLWAL
jgi:hypothetical protein